MEVTSFVLIIFISHNQMYNWQEIDLSMTFYIIEIK